MEKVHLPQGTPATIKPALNADSSGTSMSTVAGTSAPYAIASAWAIHKPIALHATLSLLPCPNGF